jgi:hypothetical protein
MYITIYYYVIMLYLNKVENNDAGGLAKTHTSLSPL